MMKLSYIILPPRPPRPRRLPIARVMMLAAVACWVYALAKLVIFITR